MDSMRSLNRSLPSARSSRHTAPEDLLPAFKQAALSVTNLYKSAANYHDSMRQAGYQDALDDLLKFLDQENLGLQDGEGWRVRQWATTRYDVSHLQQSESDEEEAAEPENANRSSSPEKHAEEEEHPQSEIQQTPSSSQDNHSQQSNSGTEPPQQSTFQFSAGTDQTMQSDDSTTPSEQKRTPLRVEVINRTNRNAHRHNNRHPSRAISRSTPQTAGSKRKMPFPDISEIFDLGFEKKDNFEGGGGGGGTKRNRLV